MRIKDKMSKVDNNYSVYIYDNGYMLEISGRNSDDEWTNAKIMCATKTELFVLIDEIDTMEKE